MAKYKVLERSFINHAIREPGDVVEYDGMPGPNLELVKEGDLPFFPPSHYMKCRRLRNAVLEDRCGPLTARHRATNPQVRPPIWAFNIARRSYISYRLACAGANYAELSNEVGNSEAMIRQHYFRHVSRQAARAYFSLTPDRV